jgi:ribose-phosphate pyrophosphokinase
MILVDTDPLNILDFPNREKKITYTPTSPNTICVKFKWESDADFMTLYFLSEKLRSLGRTAYLHIMYLPYSRMDRQMGEDFFTLKYICKFINSLGFISIYVNEPHSDVSMALLDNAVAMKTTKKLFDNMPWEADITICYPDAGAQKRYSYPNISSVLGEKERDPATGKITKYKLHGEVIKGRSIVILDDLCSYGGTFVLAAEALKARGAGDIYLIVAHCEKSILKGEIFSSGLIKQVITTNSIINKESATDRLKIIGVI